MALAVRGRMIPADDAPPHWVDCTMFWSAAGGGVRRYLLAKRDWMRRARRWRHTVFVPGGVGPGYSDAGGLPLPGSGGYRFPVRRAAAAQALVDLQPQLIEAGDPYRLAWAAADAAQRLGVPCVAFCHSNLPAMAMQWVGPQHRRTARWAGEQAARYLRRTYQRYDLVVAPSMAMTRALQGLGLTQVVCQPLGVDTSAFHPGCASTAWRASLGLPADARLLLYAGRFAPEKQLDTLVEAVQRLGPRYWLLALGSGPVVPHGERVRVLPYEGRAAAVARALASADAVVHAGDQETFGLSVLEAMACGTPVVVRQAGGLSELVPDGAGVRVDSPHGADWAEALTALFEGDRQRQGAIARRTALQHDWQQVFGDLSRRYQALPGWRGSAADARASESRPLPRDTSPWPRPGTRLGDVLVRHARQ